MPSKQPQTMVPSQPSSVRMLVLETDDPHPETQKEKGSFGDILNDLLQKAGDDHEPKLGIKTEMQYIVEDKGGKVPNPEEIEKDIHAILITGSEYDAHSNVDWILKLMKFIEHIWIHRPDIRFTGICFGHQIICRTLGARVEPNANGEWELSHTSLTISGIGQKLFNLPKNTTQIHLHQMHLDQVINPPSPATTSLLSSGTKVHVWGKSEHTGVQGVYIHKRLLSTQGHMEFNEKMVRRQLEMRVNNGALEKEVADEATETADWMHDGLLVAKAVLRFFHGDDDNIE